MDKAAQNTKPNNAVNQLMEEMQKNNTKAEPTVMPNPEKVEREKKEVEQSKKKKLYKQIAIGVAIVVVIVVAVYFLRKK